MGWNAGVVRSLCAVVAIGASGCNTTQNMTTPDTGPREDAGPIVQPLVATVGGTVDLSCVGTATLPASTTPVTATLHIIEFLSMAAITGNGIDIFTNDVITDTCAAPDCTHYNTDASGDLTLTLSSGNWFAYRLSASGQTAPVISYDLPWITTAGETPMPAYGFSPGTITAVGMLFNRTFQADRFGSMSGRAVDCAQHPLANVRARVFVGDTEVLTGPLADTASPRITGLEGTAPTRNSLTGQSGNFVGANIPPSEDAHVETWAVRTAGGEPELIGCTQTRVLIGGITLAIVSPLRSDYPAGSRCALAAAAAGH